MRAFNCVEGVPFEVDPPIRDAVRRASRRLQGQLRPRCVPIEESNAGFVVSGVIGTIDIGGALLEVVPKTEPQNDWIEAVLDLITGIDRLEPAGERSGGMTPMRRGLLDALACLYARKLSSAINRDGPIVLLERARKRSRRLNGKLEVTDWAKRAAWRPHIFPTSRSRLTSENDFCRSMSYVASTLASASTSPAVKRLLLHLAAMLCPQPWQRTQWHHGVIYRPLPQQWAAFRPAWDICVTVLSKRSPIGAQGGRHGLSVAIEVWALLERLLQRALEATCRRLKAENRAVASPEKARFPLLKSAIGTRSVIPDGRLVENGRIIATFEAKYNALSDPRRVPRGDTFQALCTASACRSPLAVLVYPDSFAWRKWSVPSMGGFPQALAIVGLDMYSYRRGAGDEKRGSMIVDLLKHAVQ